jgi:transposase-like protein
LLYQRKDSVLAATAIQKVLGKQLAPKRSVVDVMKSMQKIKQPHITRNAPIRHREVGVR